MQSCNASQDAVANRIPIGLITGSSATPAARTHVNIALFEGHFPGLSLGDKLFQGYHFSKGENYSLIKHGKLTFLRVKLIPESHPR